MADTVFWSWQSDSNQKSNRNFIRDALSKAVDRVSQDLGVEDAERVELDHDTKSASGMADISNTILEQVSAAAVFVADVTPIATAESGKKIPNPNVMVELGYALHALGFEKIIAILNRGDGHKIEELPFDIRHRRILTYCLSDDADKSERKREGDKLAKDLAAAIKGNIENTREARSLVTPIVGVAESKDYEGLWEADWPVKHQSRFGDSNLVNPTNGERAFLRVIPECWSDGLPQITLLEDQPDGKKLWASSGGGSAGSYGPCACGYISYWFANNPSNASRDANNIVGFLEETGEIWFSDGAVFNMRNKGRYLHSARLLSNWASGLETANDVLDELGASKRRRVIVGISSLKEVAWSPQIGHSLILSRKSSFTFEKTEPVWAQSNQIVFLHSAWNRVRNAFSLPEMSADEFQSDYTTRKGQ